MSCLAHRSLPYPTPYYTCAQTRSQGYGAVIYPLQTLKSQMD